jgi:hypothetical protein
MDMDKEEAVRKEAVRVLVATGILFNDDPKTRNKVNTPTINYTKTFDDRPETGRPSQARVSNISSPNGEPENKRDDTSGGTRTIAAVPGIQMYTPTTASGQRINTSGNTQNNNSTRSGPSTAPTANYNGDARVPSMAGGNLPQPLQGHNFEDIEIYFRDSLVGEPEQQAVIDQVRQMAAADFVLKEVEEMENESALLPDLGLDLDLHQPLKYNFKKNTRRRMSLELNIKSTKTKGKQRTANDIL